MADRLRPGRPRVLIVVPTLVDGGVTPFNLALAAALRTTGLEVEQFALQTYDPSVVGQGYSEQPVTVGPGRFGYRRIGVAVSALRLLRAARRADIIVSGWEVGLGVVASVLAGRLTGRPVVGELQADPIQSLMSILEYDWAPWWTIPAARRVYPRLDAVVCVSDGLRERAPLLGVSPDVVTMIPNGIDLRRVRRLAAEAVPEWWPAGEVAIGVGRLAAQKGFDVLIRAHARARQAGSGHTLVIVGEGPDRPALERLAADEGVASSVILAGYLENPFAAMAHASLFCLSSRYEGFGLVLAEALALGVPVISTDCVSGPSQVLGDGRYGELVPVDSVDRMAEAIERHFAMPATLTEKASASVDRYSIDETAAAYRGLFDELLSRTASR